MAEPRGRDLLRALYPPDAGGVIELRAKPRGADGTRQAWFAPDDYTGLGAFLKQHRTDHDVWFGVALRDAPGHGSRQHCTVLPALFLDSDQPPAQTVAELKAWAFPPSAIVHSGGGLHAYWTLAEPWTLATDGDPDPYLRRLATFWKGDLKAAEAARVLRLPGGLNLKYAPPREVRLLHLSDAVVNVSDLDELLPPDKAPRGRGQSWAMPDDLPPGERNSDLYKMARSLKQRGLSIAEVRAACHAVNAARCTPPLEAAEVDAMVDNAFRQPDRPGYTPPAAAPPDAPPGAAIETTRYHTTDTGNAEAFAARFADDVRFDHRRRVWRIWRAPVWAEDADGAVVRHAIALIRQRYHDATTLEDLDRRALLAKHAIGSERRERVTALLELAKKLAPVSTAGDAWDADPWLFACTNGVLDLRAGVLRAASRGDHLTQLAGTAFDPAAPCARWRTFLDEIFAGDEALVAFLQRSLGYALTGLVSEQTFWMFHGTGANGKSTLIAVLQAVLGTYAATTPFATIEAGRPPGGIPNDLAALAGRRFVTASEVKERARFDEARIKGLTAGDRVPARFMHGEWFDFAPALKLFLAVNHKPDVTDDSHGFWRRVHLVPFARQFEKNDTLRDELRGELPGILAWLVEGCRAWQRDGLNPPAVVQAATAQYRQDSDQLGDFLREECVVGSEVGPTRAAALYDRYKSWADREGLEKGERWSSTRFGRRLAERFVRDADVGGRRYHGIGLKTARGDD
jgi:putative DNA primase/helicase